MSAQSNLNDDGQAHTINANDSYQDFLIPADTDLDRLQFIMEGGDGGKFRYSNSCKADGGDGARVTMVFRVGTSGNDLRPGGIIRFIPGRRGFNQFSDGGAGGGGGSAVLYKKPNVTVTATTPSTSFTYQNSNWIILGVAGGGGGAQGVYENSTDNSSAECHKDAGSSGSTETSGTGGGGSNDGGTNGNGGETGNDTRDGGAGAGYLTDGDQNGTDSKNGKKGGFTGGNGGTCSNCRNGGFGYGGGGGGKNGSNGGGGGGGGYSGGGGGNNGNGFANNGGGGGSFVNNTDVDAFRNIEFMGNTSNPQHGYITYAFRSSGGIEANCKDITVTLDNGTATITPQQVNNESVVGPAEQMELIFVSVLDLGVGIPVEVPLANVNYDCSALGMQEVTLKVISSSGQTANCTANIEVKDDVAPTVICETFGGIFAPIGLGRDFTLEIDNLETSSTDACGTIVNKTLSQTVFTCDDIGNHTVTLFVEDNNGNVGTCTAIVGVTAVDQPLQLTCPANITVPVAPGNCSADIAEGLQPINLKGPCDASLSYAITETTNIGNTSTLETGQGTVGSVSFLIGTTQIDYELSAPNGEQTSCSFTVTVSPDNPPSASCQDITLQLDDNGQATLTPSQIDNGSSFCNASSLSLSQSSFDCNLLGINTVELFIQEGAIQSTCLANVYVVDNTPPVLDCIDITIQLNANGVAEITPAEVQGNSYDNCGLIVNQSLSKTNFICVDGVSQIVTLSAEDPGGNQSTCTFEVVLQDNLPPQVVCKDLTVQLDEFGEASFNESFLELSSYDACGLVPIEQDPLLEFDCDDLGVHSLPFSRLDNQGNIGTCNASVIIEDRLAPTITCQDVTVSLLDNSAPSESFTLETDVGLAAISDNCTASANNFVISNGFSIHCNNIGENAHTLLATDESGNYASCSIAITVIDDSKPMANCKDATVQLDENGTGNLLTSDVDDNSFDHCGIQSLALSQANFDCTAIGEQSIILTVTDNNNNTATCSVTVTVEDNIAPTALCEPVIVYLSSPTLSGAQLGAGSTDNCTSSDDLFFYHIFNNGESVASSLTFDCAQVGVVDIYGVDVFDEELNRISCFTTITVIDDILPSAYCKDVTVELDDFGFGSISPEDVDNESFDNCNLQSLTLSQMDFDCSDLGDHTVTLTVTDLNSNTSSCSANVFISGLPCGWQADHIDCPNGSQAGYDHNSGTFNMSTENCFDPNYYSNSDSQGTIKQEFCGDGEIIAHVNALDGNAWAGIFMRESNDPGAKALQLAVNNVGLAQRKLRTAIGGYAFNHLFQNQGKQWLRLTRSGNQFGAFMSLDGIQWDMVLLTNISMSNCIQIGLFVSNATFGGTAAAWFDQVQIKPPLVGSALQAPNVQHLMTNTQFFNHTDVQIYPNPTSGALNVEIGAFMDQPVEILVLNQQGQILETKLYNENHAPTEKLWLEHLQNGLYFIRIKVKGCHYTKKVNIIH